MTDRRTLISDATIATIAREGMRGVTHRAVDRAAGLPEGSTSYYFRTRDALLFAALDRMAELDTVDIGDLPSLGGSIDLDKLTTLLTALVQRWLTTARERTLARFELTLESTRRPDMRARLVEIRSGFYTMSEHLLAALGATEPRRSGTALVAFVDGLTYHQLAAVGAAQLGDADLRAACRDLLRTALC